MTDEPLKQGDFIRLRLADSGEDGDWARARVEMASTKTDPRQSVVIMLLEPLRVAHGALVLCAWPLSVDYENATVTDLFGGEYEVEVRGEVERCG